MARPERLRRCCRGRRRLRRLHHRRAAGREQRPARARDRPARPHRRQRLRLLRRARRARPQVRAAHLPHELREGRRLPVAVHGLAAVRAPGAGRVDGQLVPIPINRTTVNELYGLDARRPTRRSRRSSPSGPSRSTTSATSEDVVVVEGRARAVREVLPRLHAQAVAARPVRAARVGLRADPDAHQHRRPLLHRLRSRRCRPTATRRCSSGSSTTRGSRCGWRPTSTTCATRSSTATSSTPGPIDRYFDHRFGALPYRSLEFELRNEPTPGRRARPAGRRRSTSRARTCPYTRTTEFRHMTGPGAHASSTLHVEYPRDRGRPLLPDPERRHARALQALRGAGARPSRDVTFVGPAGALPVPEHGPGDGPGAQHLRQAGRASRPRRGRLMPRPSRSPTTTCWSCAAPSGPSPRWRRSGRRRRSTRCSTTSAARTAASPTAGSSPRVSSAWTSASDNFRRLLPLYPAAVRRMRLDAHELLVSSSSAFAHGMRAAPGAAHVCYCHSPFRYAWHDVGVALGRAARRRCGRAAVARAAPPPRFDRRATRRLTGLIANSRITQERIRRYWGRDAPIVHPPVDVVRFVPSAGGEDLLFVGEITRHKRVELALEAAELAGRRIRVVGEGPELPRLRRRFQRSAEFLGRVGDEELRTCTPPAARSSCRAWRSSGSRRSRRRPRAGR